MTDNESPPLTNQTHCENCGGTGEEYFGHALVKCGQCGGSGDATPPPVPPPGQQGIELPQMVHGPCQLTNGREWVVFQSAGAMIPPPGCPWNVPEGFSAVRISPPAAASEGERIADLKAAIARIKSKFPRHRGDVGSPDVPVLQERYDALRAALAASESDRREAERFKAWVHSFLDGKGVPHDPDPEGNKEHGCRISGRMKWLFARLSAAEQSAAAMREALTKIADIGVKFGGAGEAYKLLGRVVIDARAALSQPENRE